MKYIKSKNGKINIGIHYEQQDLDKHMKKYNELYEKIQSYVQKKKDKFEDFSNDKEYLDLIKEEKKLNTIGKHIRCERINPNASIKKIYGKRYKIIGLNIAVDDPCKKKICRDNCVLGVESQLRSKKTRNCIFQGTILAQKKDK